MVKVVKKTWDDQRLKSDRLVLIQKQMKKRGIGAVYLSDHVNMRYVLNLKIPGAELFVPAEGEPLGFVRSRDMGFVKQHHQNVQLPIYTRRAIRDGTRPEEIERFAQGIIELMKRHGVASQVLGLDTLGVAAVLALTKAGISLTDARPVFEHAGSVKTPDEIAIYRSISEQYAHTINAFRNAIRPGISENELAAVVVSAWYEAGGEDIAQLNVCAGENMNPWRRWPSQRTLNAGELVGIDLHGRGLNGLRGDVSRTFFVGDRPTVEQRDLYRRAFDYLVGAVDVFQAGRSFADVIRSVPEVPEKYRARFYTLNLAHGVGMGSSGYPQIDKHKSSPDDTLKPNQVLAIECFFGEEENPLAVKLEEMILVCEGKPQILTSTAPFEERLAA